VAYVVVNHLINLGTYYDLFAGIGLILTVVFNPMGIAGKTREDLEKVRARLVARRGGGAPGATVAADEADRGGSIGLAVAGASHHATASDIGPVIMEAANVSVTYGGVRALRDLTIEVRRGEIVGLIGPNGSGKTSFIDGITGFTAAEGRVLLEGAPLEDLPAHRRARAGLVRTWQSIELFQDLPTGDNVLATAPSTWRSIFKDVFVPGQSGRGGRAVAEEFPYLADVMNRRPAELSLGHQKMLGLARALSMKPKCLLLDEPAAGLDTSESMAFGQYLRDIANRGTACLLIDHDMGFVMSICDRLYVLNFGQLIAHGTPDDVSNDPLVREAYLGKGHALLSAELEEPAISGAGRSMEPSPAPGEYSR
jgi:ABC-type branched-subunit amino acid transport system ATPase component